MRTIVSFPFVLATLLSFASVGCAGGCPYPGAKGAESCPLVVTRQTARVPPPPPAPRPPDPVIPSFFRPPDPVLEASAEWFRGDLLKSDPPERLYTPRCVSCDCSKQGKLERYDDWQALNKEAYAELRKQTAPYALAVVPGYGAATEAGLAVTRLRVQAALRLLQQGWVAALMLSGGHQRGGFNEARFMARIAEELGKELDIEVKGRLFIEPCACHSVTNARNSLQMLEAMGIHEALLVTEGDSIPHQAPWFTEMDAQAQKHLGCYVGRFAPLRGPTSALGVPLTQLKCWLRPDREKPGCAGHGTPTVFWISPGGRLPGGAPVKAGGCPLGSSKVASCEPKAGHGCASYKGRVLADRRAAGLHAHRIELEQELEAFDPRFDCPKQGSRLPDALFQNAPPETRTAYETMCLRELPEHQDKLLFLRRRLGSFAVLGTQVGFTDKGVASDFGYRAELFYRTHWRVAELTRWRHEMGVFSTLMASGDWLGTSDSPAAHLELGPGFELGAWFRPRFADAPLPMALLSLGYALPTRSGRNVAPTSWLGASIPSLIGPISVAPTFRLTRELSRERQQALGYQLLLELGVRLVSTD